MIDISRKQFTTTIEEYIQDEFRKACSERGHKMNDVLETFMKAYIDDDISLKVEKTVKLTLVRNGK